PQVSLPLSRWYTRILIVCQLKPVSIVRKMPSIPDGPVVSHGPSISSGFALGIFEFSWPGQKNAVTKMRPTRRSSIGGYPFASTLYSLHAIARLTAYRQSAAKWRISRPTQHYALKRIEKRRPCYLAL